MKIHSTKTQCGNGRSPYGAEYTDDESKVTCLNCLDRLRKKRLADETKRQESIRNYIAGKKNTWIDNEDGSVTLKVINVND